MGSEVTQSRITKILDAMPKKKFGKQVDFPEATFSEDTGFTWVDMLKSVDCDSRDKVACQQNSKVATVVTKQVLSCSHTCDFQLKIISAGSEEDVLVFGLVDEEPLGFADLPIGHANLPNSVGAWCFRNGGGEVHRGKITDLDIPGVKDGDVVKIKVREGSDKAHVSFWKGSSKFSAIAVGNKRRFRLGVSMSSPGQKVEILDHKGGKKASSMEGMLQQVLHDVSAPSKLPDMTLPEEHYLKTAGFTWVDALRSVDCDGRDKVAKCVEPRLATMITKQVLTSSDECEFVVRVISAGADKDVIAFGVVDENPGQFGQLPLGHSDLKASIGAWCMGKGGGLVHQGEVSRVGQVPGVKDGDILKIKVEKTSGGSEVSLCKNSTAFHSFTVGGKCRFRVAMSMGTPGQKFEILDAAEAGKEGTMLQEVFAAVFDNLPQGEMSHVDVPVASYSDTTGFTWVDNLKSIDCDQRKKMALKLKPRMNTIVTRQVLTASDECDFLLKVVSAGGERDFIIFGVVNDNPTGFGKLPIGHKKLPASIGAWCLRHQGCVVHKSNIDKEISGVAEGDILKISIQKGSDVSLWKDSSLLTSFTVGGDGKFRLGVSLSTPGQKVEILESSSKPESSDEDETAEDSDDVDETAEDPDESDETAEDPDGSEVIGSDSDGSIEEASEDGADEVEPDQVLTVGCTVRLPDRHHPRLQEMRTKFVDSMKPHCGMVGRVLSVSKRSATIEWDGDDFHWDLDVFPRDVERRCPHGCELKAFETNHSSYNCDVCRTRLPRGYVARSCRQHDFDICEFCQGNTVMPEMGSKVIRGPTWKWGDQDGQKFAEGVCKKDPSPGWLKVDWPQGCTNCYRVDEYYQDVWPVPAGHASAEIGKSETKVGAEKGGVDVPGQMPDTEEEEPPATPAASARRGNSVRWGDGLDAVDAGTRDFLPSGWIPKKDVLTSIQVFGLDDSDCQLVMTSAKTLAEELAALNITSLKDKHAAAVFAYTQENEKRLYSKLNTAMRAATLSAEKKLEAYRDYIYHLCQALPMLPGYVGKAFRGVNRLLPPELYAVGKTITWQPFTSTTRKQSQALNFLGQDGKKLHGLFLVLDVSAGRNVEDVSAFPDEAEILILPNSHWKVTKQAESIEEKKRYVLRSQAIRFGTRGLARAWALMRPDAFKEGVAMGA
ncbi:HERC2 [Symbiodinium microadriaticum]|nr:HERC2 [Symbiodinium microadriaticum]CAE7940321.1 HERC2 [Symbiodinium sp. KB8]